MTYGLKDVKHLEIMAALEDAEVPEVIQIPLLEEKSPSGFDFQLLSLCSELRKSGLEKEAASLEDKFLVYKQAASLYGVFKETGESLMDDSHPEGDVKKGPSDKDYGDVETFPSQQEKIKKIVNKEPTGKLASYVEKCKIVLAQSEFSINDLDSRREVYQKALKQSELAIKYLEQIEKIDDDDDSVNSAKGRATILKSSVIRAVGSISDANIKAISGFNTILNTMERELKPSFLFGGLDNDSLFKTVQQYIQYIRKSLEVVVGSLNSIIEYDKKYYDKKIEDKAKFIDDSKKKIESMISFIEESRKKINLKKFSSEEEKKSTISWLLELESDLNKLNLNLPQMSFKNVNEEISSALKDIESFKNNWKL